MLKSISTKRTANRILTKHTLDCEDKSSKLTEIHTKTYANSHAVTPSPKHHPLNFTVTSLNLQCTVRASKDAERQNGEEDAQME